MLGLLLSCNVAKEDNQAIFRERNPIDVVDAVGDVLLFVLEVSKMNGFSGIEHFMVQLEQPVFSNAFKNLQDVLADEVVRGCVFPASHVNGRWIHVENDKFFRAFSFDDEGADGRGVEDRLVRRVHRDVLRDDASVRSG